jgi:RNA polymerase sigma factor (sigma-70 family)
VRFKTWLFGIAIVHCAEAARRQSRLRRLLGVKLPAAESARSAPALDAEQYFWPLAVADRETVRERLDGLPEGERHILELYYYAELTLPEIAKLLGTDVWSVRKRFYAAHRLLRERLQPVEAAESAAPAEPPAARDMESAS